MTEPVYEKKRHPFVRLGELFEASALGLVTLLLLCASFFATWRGMGDFIASRDLGGGAASKGLVFLIVATLSLAMYVALREMIAPYYARGWWSQIWKRVIAGILYAVLALWSIGFGYGFWWSLVAGQDATELGLQRTVASMYKETSDMRAEIAAAIGVMSSAVELSDLKAQQEQDRGGTCGINSSPGSGPLSRARAETQVQVAALAVSAQRDFHDSIDARLGQLEASLERALKPDATLEAAARKTQFEELGRSTQRFADDATADASTRGRVLAEQLRTKSARLSIAPEDGVVAYCYDPDLAASLEAAADALDQTYTIKVVPFRFAEGPDGVARAIEDLIDRVGQPLGVGAEAHPPKLEGRDLIALLAAIGVDLALFVFALLRGGGGRRYASARNRDEPVIIIEQAASAPIQKNANPKLPPPRTAKTTKGLRKLRREADPSAVGIGTSAAGSQSQLPHDEQVEALIESVDGIYRLHSKDELVARKNNEIQRLQAELDRLKAIGYVAMGLEEEVFDNALHREVGRQPSDKAEGIIIATVKPGYLLSNGGLRRVAEVIVSAGPEPDKNDD